MLNNDNNAPLPLDIMAYQGEFPPDWNLVLSFITLSILPIIVDFFLAQKCIVAGQTDYLWWQLSTQQRNMSFVTTLCIF